MPLWTDHKGRKVVIASMSDKWLNNIRKECKGHPDIKLIKEELKRRKNKKKNGRI